MNKKFLSALLCGATLLASTSTFVSCKDYDDDINSLENKLKNEISAREALDAKVKAAEAAIADLQAAKADLEAKLASLSAKHDADIAAINAEIATINAAIEKLQKALEDYATKKELAAEVAALNVSIDAALQSAKAYTDAAQAVLQTQIDGLKSDLAATNTKLEKVASDLADVTAKYNTLNDKLYGANGDIARLDAAIKAQADALEAAKKALEQADADNAKKIADLEKVLKEQIADLKKAVEDADKKLQEQVDAVKTELAKKANKDDVEKSLAELRADVEASFATVNKAIDEVNAAVKEITDNKIPSLVSEIAKVDDKYDVATTVLSKKLRSMVLRPQLYVDGIEAIQYRVLFDEDITITDKYQWDLKKEVHNSWDPSIRDKQKVRDLTDYQIDGKVKSVRFWNSPVWPVVYHMNPSTSEPSFSQIKGWFTEEKEIVNRAVTDDLGLSVEENYGDYANGDGEKVGSKLFSIAGGDLTVGIRINDPRPLFFNGPRVVNGGCEHAEGHMDVDNPCAADCDVVYGETESTHFNPANGAWGGGTENLAFNPWLAMETTAGVDVDAEWFSGKKIGMTVNTKHNHLDNIVALEVKDPDAVITSDYGLLHATGITIEGLVWRKEADKIKSQKATLPTLWPCDEKIYDYNGYEDPRAGATGTYLCNTECHVFDTPEEALLACNYDERNYVCLPWDNSGDKIKLEDYLAIHWYEQSASRNRYYGVQTWNFTGKYDDPTKDLRNYGVWYEFETVDYKIDGNVSRDSRYMQLADAKIKATPDEVLGTYDRQSPTGELKAGRVLSTDADRDGVFEDVQSKGSVGREPLVRVLVHAKDNAGTDHVILDGYILVKITKKLETTEVAFDKTLDNFDLCNGQEKTLINWAVFSDKVLDGIFDKNYTKTMFDAVYGPEEHDSRVTRGGASVGTLIGAADGFWEEATPVTAGQDTYKFRCHLYADNGGVPAAEPDKNVLGEVIYYHDAHSATNFKVNWKFSAADLEYITHTCGNQLGTGTYSAWIRWTAHNTNHVAGDLQTGENGYPNDLKGDNAAKYDIIWVKLTVKVGRDHVATYSFEDKIDNYWWGMTQPGQPADETGWDAIITNVLNPVNNQSADLWLTETWRTLDGNVLKLHKDGGDAHVATNYAKYFVAPIDKEVVSRYDVNSTGAGTNHASDLRAGTVCDPTSHQRPLKWNVNTEIDKTTGKHDPTNDVTYVITAFHPTDNPDFNDLVPVYQANYNTGIYNYDGSYAGLDAKYGNACPTTHKWDSEAHANEVVDACATRYDAGVYNNEFIYVVRKDQRNSGIADAFHKLAKLDQATGTIELYHDSYTYAVLNAIGYDKNDTDKQALDTELRAMIGVIAKDKCNLAQKMQNSIFMTSWERPINMKKSVDYAIDARSNANRIYLADIIKLYDYRGDSNPVNDTSSDPQKVRGDMERPFTKWLWAYYDCYYTKVDFTLSKMETTLGSPNGGPEDWKKLSVIDPNGLIFRNNSGLLNQVVTYTFPVIRTYNNSNRSLALYTDFNSNTALRDQIGYIIYDNNQYNVQKFKLRIPITIGYVWGELTEVVEINVDSTIGNED